MVNVIELLYASARGDIWHVAINCMGLVMMVIVMSAYSLKDFCNISSYVYTGVCAAALVAVYVYWRQHAGVYLLWQIETAVLNVWWIGLVLKHLFKKIIIEKSISFKPNLLGWLWIALSVLMICSVSGRVWPLWYLLMFGCFYLTKYTDEDKKALWDGMIYGTIISFFGIQIYAYGFRPYDEVRYKGAFSNCNMMALYYLIVYAMILFKLHLLEREKAKKGWKLFYLIGAGGLLSFQFLTMGRTAWITSIAITFLYGILVIRKIWKKKWTQVVARGVALVLTMMMTFPIVFATVRWLPTILHRPIWYVNEGYSEDKVHSFDPANSWKYVEMDEFLYEVFGRIYGTLRQVGSNNPLVIQTRAMERVDLVELPWTEDQGLVYRFTIYKAYWDDLTFVGNPQGSGMYLLGEGGFHSWHAQNLWLQIAYSFGIPAGVVFVVLSMVMLGSNYKVLNKNQENEYSIIPFFIGCIFLLFGTMEVVWNPGQLIMFLLFFVQHPKLTMRNVDE